MSVLHQTKPKIPVAGSFLLVDKPENLSSNGALYALKRQIQIKKLGHTGTLDPFATGLLFVAVGEATKFLPYIQNDPKEYHAILKLGQTTTTLDSAGEISEQKQVPEFHAADLKVMTQNLLGTREQLAPIYSAKKINGERSYDLARSGQEVSRKSCVITVHELEFTEVQPLQISFRAVCAAGTYIRVLGEEIAHALGTVGYLTQLRRTKMGLFSIEKALTLNQVTLDKLSPISDALDYPTLNIETNEWNSMRVGKTISKNSDDQGLVRLFHEGTFLGLGESKNGFVSPHRLIQT